MMKNILNLLFLCLALSATAQDGSSEKVRFGIRAGMGVSHMNFDKGSPPPEVPIETSWDPGLTVGALMIVPLTGDFYLQPEYLYSQRGGEVTDPEIQYDIDYFSLPVLLRWEPLDKFSVLAGPEFGLVINAQEETAGDKNSIIHDVEQRHLGATFEVGYRILGPLTVAARFMHGISHVGLREGTAIQEFKYELFQVSAVYIF